MQQKQIAHTKIRFSCGESGLRHQCKILPMPAMQSEN